MDPNPSPKHPDTPAAELVEESRKPAHLLHPVSGALILGLDWMLFSGAVATGGLTVVGASIAGFLAASLGTALVQARITPDSALRSIVKGLAAGAVVGLPFPIAGTVVGGTILALSGLNSVRRLLPGSRG